jgi:predicted PurR-regulated permease PerM
MRDPRAGTRQPIPIDSRARTRTRTVVAMLIVILALWVARDFLSALAWAGAIAITMWPIYVRFAPLILNGRSPALSALLFTLVTGTVLLVPIVLVVHQIAQASDAFTHWLAQLQANGIPVPAWVARLPIAGQYFDRWWQANLSDPKVMVEWLGSASVESITAWVSAFGGALLHRMFLFLITLIALFLILRDGEWLANQVLATTDRLLGNPGERLASKLGDAIRGTVNGTIAAAVAEGAIIGVAYALAGVPHPLLFTALTMTLAMLPFGAWVAFTAAALILLFQGGSALLPIGLFAFGATVMLIGDNVIQPGLIGGTARLPFLLVLIGILGGIQSFGLVGLFLGPVIMAALVTVWREWVGGGLKSVPRSPHWKKPHRNSSKHHRIPRSYAEPKEKLERAETKGAIGF